jgi:hypothetical protein
MTPDPVAATLQLAETQLSFRARVGHLALLLAASGMGVVVASLLLTEPALPRRTVIAFAAMLLISLSWVAYALWVLTARKTLLANHRVVAGRIAAAAASIFTAGAALLGVTLQMAAAYAAAGLGALLLTLAIVLLARAQRQYQALLARRAALESQLR